MKIHIAAYKRVMNPDCGYNDYRYNYFVVIWINNKACFSCFFENRPHLKKKLTKNIIRKIKKSWDNDSSLKQYYDHTEDLVENFASTNCIWKQLMNIFYII